MSVSKKIKSMLSANGKKQKDLAEYFGIDEKAMNNRFYRDSFSASDLIKIASFCDASLSFTMSDDSKITLTESDLKDK